MTNTEIIKNTLSSIEEGNFAKAKENISNDFKFSGAVPNPVGVDEWLNLHRALNKAFPDLNFNLKNVKEVNSNSVKGTVSLSGTQKNELNVNIPGMKPIAATGKKIQLPEEPVEFTFENGKLTKLKVTPVAGGGVMGIYKQLGAEVPEMQKM